MPSTPTAYKRGALRHLLWTDPGALLPITGAGPKAHNRPPGVRFFRASRAVVGSGVLPCRTVVADWRLDGGGSRSTGPF
jgi:hypothetical protein